MTNIFYEYARLIRLPGLGGFSIAPIFGAISLINTGVDLNYTILFILLILGILKSIFGIVSNDYADIEIDKLSKDANQRPLVKGTISKNSAILICLFCFFATFVIVFVFFYKNQLSFYLGVLCILLAAVLGLIYNFYGKKIVYSAFIGALADGLYVLVGAFLVTNDVYLSVFTWAIFLLVFTQYLFMTAVVGGIKDADHDYILNVKNLALASGVKVYEDDRVFIPLSFKIFSFGIRLFSGFIVFVPFVFYGANYELWHMLLLILVVGVVLYLTVYLLNIKKIEREGKMVKILGLQGVFRYTFIPIMLIPVIGLLYSFLLIIFPLLWFLLFKVTVVKDYFAS